MGAGGFHVRVRDGIGWGTPAMTTRSSNPPSLWEGECGSGVLCASKGDTRALLPGDDFHAW